MRPISDRAELDIDFPEKVFMGSFSRSSAFEALADRHGVTLRLRRLRGERRVASLHLRWQVFADMLEELALVLAAQPPIDEADRRRAAATAGALAAALQPRA